MTDVSARIPVLQNGKVIVSVTAGVCLLLLTIIMKNILHVPAEQLSSDIVIYIIIYMGFVISFPFLDETERIPLSRTMVWVFIIVMVTLAIIGIYAF